ncbi:phage shock protein operon transcriptional activator [Zobellella taiwanensis]|jgi:psp operon transcriptional activator|uniref:Phage shock protein operon transcriptional activator n=1 Tax=Zobellella taiwanensis TaxID=347535 RepID=A0A2P7R0Z4_9GAMM|nr:phage shock protein operon transcriptional activator [Zobellella taiwanensis]PSJ43878.1 phage shock protein operon transcriptional activator [Zobellella taiwanensis]
MDIELIGQSNALLGVLDQVSLLAPLDRPVLVVGERGTGKELIAQRLHYLSSRWQQPFISLNCATLAETLLESELFGHEAGAFTGAQKRHLGRFERADGGTLFLDELATTSARVQEKLLRAIEYGEFERVGGSQPVKVDVRLLCATNQDLPELVEKGEFRADLLDRLAFDVVTLPPLRARDQDILRLAEHFAVALCMELGWPLFAGFAPAARRRLLEHPWPGNVRELKNVVERSLYRHGCPQQPLAELCLDPFASPWRPGGGPGQQAAPALPLDLRRHLAEQEHSLVQTALARARYNQRQAAGLLGLSYHQLRGLLRKHAASGAAEHKD